MGYTDCFGIKINVENCMYSMYQVDAWYMYVFTSEWHKSQKPKASPTLFNHSFNSLFIYYTLLCNCYACSYYSTRTDGYLAHIVITTI